MYGKPDNSGHCPELSGFPYAAVYAADLICSTGVSGFQTFKPVFSIYNKLRLHAEMLS